MVQANAQKIIIGYTYQSKMSNKDETIFVEQAAKVYGKMSLLELLSEENMLQRYRHRYKERIMSKLHFILEQEISLKFKLFNGMLKVRLVLESNRECPFAM